MQKKAASEVLADLLVTSQVDLHPLEASLRDGRVVRNDVARGR